MNHEELAISTFDNNFRIEKIFYLAGLSNEPNDDFKEFLDYENITTLEKCFGKCPDYIKKEIKKYGSIKKYGYYDIISDWSFEANQRYGFIVQIATPVLQGKSVNDIYFNWSCFRTEWFYFEDLKNLNKVAVEWVNKISKEK